MIENARYGTWTCYHLKPGSREWLGSIYARDDIPGDDLYDHMVESGWIESIDQFNCDGDRDYVAVMGKTSSDDDFSWEFVPDSRDWESLCRRTCDPKLRVIERALDVMGIQHRRAIRTSAHAPILEVLPEDHERADRVLTARLSQIGNADLGPDDEALVCLERLLGKQVAHLIRRHGNASFDEVPDDDMAFS